MWCFLTPGQKQKSVDNPKISLSLFRNNRKDRVVCSGEQPSEASVRLNSWSGRLGYYFSGCPRNKFHLLEKGRAITGDNYYALPLLDRLKNEIKKTVSKGKRKNVAVTIWYIVPVHLSIKLCYKLIHYPHYSP